MNKPAKWLIPLSVLLFTCMVTRPTKAGYQIREFETAGTLLYMSFDNASLAGYWKGNTPLSNHQAQITSGALGNSCVAPNLDVDLTDNINPKHGTIAFFTKLNNDDKPLMQMVTANGSTMMQIGKVGSWLRPWIIQPNGKAIGLESDTRKIDSNQWVHMAMVWDQQKGVRFYLDGKLASHQWGAFAYNDLRTPTTLKLATQRGIDELWIFNHPLDSTQIQALLKGRLKAPTIHAEKFPKPKQFRAEQTSPLIQNRTPYQHAIPQWASLMRKLSKQAKEITHTDNPVDFEPHHPKRLLLGQELLDGKNTTASKQVRQLIGLWKWYNQPQTFTTSQTALFPKAKTNKAMTDMRKINRNTPLPIDATMNLLAMFIAEGDTRFLNAAITNAMTDPNQVLPTLGALVCHSQFNQPRLPDVSQLTATWENLGDDVITRINRASKTSLHVTLFNFSNQIRPISLRPWSLESGQYQALMGPDHNDDDMADKISQMPLWQHHGRSDIHLIKLQPGQTVLELTQISKTPHHAASANDPALDVDWVRFDLQKDELAMDVVNLGSVQAKNLILELYADGKLLREEHISKLDGTVDQLSKYTLRYPQISSLNATHLQAKLICSLPEQALQNNSIHFAIKN